MRMVNAVPHEVCEQCGFDGSGYDDASLMTALRGLGTQWRVLLADRGPAVHARPEPGVWSAIEYAAHSRDITALHCFGVERALAEVEPMYPAIDGDDLIQTASAGYVDEKLDLVLDELDAQALRLAQLAEVAPAGSLQRGLTIGDHRMTIQALLEHALHDSLHHINDVQRGFHRLRV